ncbi:hypothetical protein KP509_12G072300 [Ceratopteris richardii]|uniref:Uncharacterized protein n=1 Tax=Ceratopteris richardii TaxID=49495 RepID=A0A8T2TPR2_CERRI|nr:hypothetical protein KP509_12G072300 [Ceratopteris richardii]
MNKTSAAPVRKPDFLVPPKRSFQFGVNHFIRFSVKFPNFAIAQKESPGSGMHPRAAPITSTGVKCSALAVALASYALLHTPFPLAPLMLTKNLMFHACKKRDDSKARNANANPFDINGPSSNMLAFKKHFCIRLTLYR